MAVDRRRTLIDAAVGLALRQRFQDLLVSVDTRSITEEAGVTTGSFFHHFRNRAHFAEAVADRFVEVWRENLEGLLADVDAVAQGGDATSVREAASSDWNRVDREVVLTGLQQLLWVARDQPLSEGATVTAGQVLGDAYGELTESLVDGYDRVLRVLGREMLPPFDLTDVAVALTALVEGLQMRGRVDGGAVRDDLYTDLVSAVVIGLTRPVSERAERSELAALEEQLVAVPRPRSDGEKETWRQIADAAAPLFADRPVSEVRISEIAEAAGVSTSTVYHQFGTVSAVAAAGWAQHLPELRTIAGEPLTAGEGPVRRIEQVLTRFVELAKQNRGMLEGLAHEVLNETAPSESKRRPRPIRREHPLRSLLEPHVRELRARGMLRRRIETDGLALSMIQLASMRVLLAPGEPTERIIDDSVGLILEGALARSDG